MTKTVLSVFRYRPDSSGILYPLITAVVGSVNNRQRLLVLVDSGATISVFRSDIADLLGIDIEKGRETYLGGVGGRIKGYIHDIEIEVAGKKFTCPVVFSREYLVSFSLLGREGFFKKFKITFDEKESKVVLE